MLRDPNNKRDDIKNAMIDEHYDELVHNYNTQHGSKNNSFPYSSDLYERAKNAPEETEAKEGGQDELQDAKYEPSHENEGEAKPQAEGGVRAKRNARKGQKSKQSQGAFSLLQKEIAMAQQPSKDDPLALSHENKVIGGQMPDGDLSARDYKIAKMMGQLSSEERQGLQQFIDGQKLSKLQAIEQ